MKEAIGATALVLIAGCASLTVRDFGSSTSGSGRASTSGTTTGGAGGGSSAGAEQLCVDTINQYRATLGLAPYER